MAQRRMFNRAITESDAFIDMPLPAQALYFHLGIAADDDGFVNSPKRVQRCIGAASDDLDLLIEKDFVIPFESGVIVIRHWKQHNSIKSDRYHKTTCLAEMAMISEAADKTYVLREADARGVACEMPEQDDDCGWIQNGSDLVPIWSQLGTEADPQSSRVESRPGEESLPGTSDADASLVEAVIEHLNKAANRSFNASTKETVTLVNARAAEGYELSDFIRVVDSKVRQWGNDEHMSKFLRPSTLFGDKFESYVNEGKVRQDDYSDYDF